MRSRTRIIVLLALAGFATSCVNLDELRSGRLDVEPKVIDLAGRTDDPTLEAPLLAILARRIDGGFTAMDDVRVVAAIQALERRRSSAAVPSLEQLVLDPVLDVQVHSLAALETLGGDATLPVVAHAARTLSRNAAREQAYHTFSILSGAEVNDLDEVALDRILAAKGHSVRSR